MMSGLELHEACTVGDYDSLEDYLESGKYDVNLKDPEWKNKTPLHWACANGHVDCVRLLLEHGAKGTGRMDMGWTPAHCAAEAGKLHVLRALCIAGVAIDRKDKYGDIPRNVAETYGHHECVKFLKVAERDQVEKRRKAGKSEQDVSSESESEMTVEELSVT